MLTRQIGLAGAILGANLRSPDLPYKVTFVATYHCNFRCEMCNIWQKKSVNEMTPEEVALFFERWPQFSWVHLTGGELFMRRDLDDLVAAIQKSCRSLYPPEFPDHRLVRRQDGRARRADAGARRRPADGRPSASTGRKALHEEMRGLPGSWDKGIETFRRLRGIKRSNFQTVVGMTLMAKNAGRVDETLAAIREVIPDFRRSELHLNVGHESGHYFDNVGYPVEQHHVDILRAIDDHRKKNGSGASSGQVPRGSVSGAREPVLRNRQVAAAVHGALVVVLRRRLLEPVSPARSGTRRSATCATTRFDLRALWDGDRRRELRDGRRSKSAARTAGRRARPTRRFSATSRARR